MRRSSARACPISIRTAYGRRWRGWVSKSAIRPKQFKAWSQNLGHEQVLTTFMSYGSVATERQGAIIRGLGAARQTTQPTFQDLVGALYKRVQEEGTSVQATGV